MIAQTSLFLFLVFLVKSSTGAGTEVKRCDDKPFPLEVRVLNCAVPPCIVYKGVDMEFEIDLVVFKYTTSMKTLVRANMFGIPLPYVLPDDVNNVCTNLMHEAYCPLYPTEDVTYHFQFPIDEAYPEISLKIEISVVDQDQEVVTCFSCDIRVRKGQANPNSLLDVLKNAD